MIKALANLLSHSRNTNMRSNLFAATLTIALGVVSPIVGAIGFPAVVAVETVGTRTVEADKFRQQGKEQARIGQIEAAVQSWQQALRIYREIKDRQGEGKTINNLGAVSSSRGHSKQAIEYLEQSLAIAREIKDREMEASSISNLGNVYFSNKNHARAIDYFEQSLAIARELGNRDHERLALNYIGLTLERQNKLDLAIGFYRQSINASESIRKDNRSLSQDRQDSYNKTVADLGKAIDYLYEWTH